MPLHAQIVCIGGNVLLVSRPAAETPPSGPVY
jgi:hypothetical protein